MPSETPESGVARAIERVLAAERDAARAIEAAQREAEALIESARAERRRILERARERATRVHAAAAARLARQLARLEASAEAPGADRSTLDTLAREAVGRVARRLAAADHEPT